MICDEDLNRKTLISVCIANFNGMALIDACIQSAMQQLGGYTIEVLVHDDASSDGSADYIRANYPGVKLIQSDVNVGFCIANNRMAAVASGQYLLLLNNDAELLPDALQTLVADANLIGAPAILTLPQYDAASGELVDRGCLLDPFFNPVPNLDPTRTDVAMVIGACLWIPKYLWVELRGFPEWFESIAEDMYLCCRARLEGYPVCVSATSGYRHWQGNSFGGNKPQDGRLITTFRRRYLSERNKLRVMVLMSPRGRLGWLLPLHFLLCAAEALVMCLVSGRWDYVRLVHWPAWREAWKARAPLRQEWQQVQWRRRATAREFGRAFTWFPRKLALLWRYGMPRLK